MNTAHSDALVFFGTTRLGAQKGISRIAGDGEAWPPGCACHWHSQVRLEPHSVEKHGGLDRPAFDKLSSLLRYVDGDYTARLLFKRSGRS